MAHSCWGSQGLHSTSALHTFCPEGGDITLLVHLLALIVGRMRVGRVHLTIALLVHLFWGTRVLPSHLLGCLRVANRW